MQWQCQCEYDIDIMQHHSFEGNGSEFTVALVVYTRLGWMEMSR